MYLLFAWYLPADEYGSDHPQGGMNDLLGVFETIYGAKRYLEEWSKDDINHSWDEAQLVYIASTAHQEAYGYSYDGHLDEIELEATATRGPDGSAAWVHTPKVLWSSLQGAGPLDND